VFLENFQKPPSGLYTAARRLIIFGEFWGSRGGTARRHSPGRQATHDLYPIYGFCLSCLAVMNTHQVRRTKFWFNFGVLSVVGWL